MLILVVYIGFALPVVSQDTSLTNEQGFVNQSILSKHLLVLFLAWGVIRALVRPSHVSMIPLPLQPSNRVAWNLNLTQRWT